LRTGEAAAYLVENTGSSDSHRRNHSWTRRPMDGVGETLNLWETLSRLRKLLTSGTFPLAPAVVTTFYTYPEPTPLGLQSRSLSVYLADSETVSSDNRRGR